MVYQPNPELGNATIEPATAVVAGTLGTWTVTYTVGRYGLGAGANIKLAWRWVSDWGTPQFDDPTAEGYTSVTNSGDAHIRPTWQRRGYIRPKSTCLLLEVTQGGLAPGETVTIVYGDTTHGSRGIRAQTYVETAWELFVLVDPTNATDPRPIADRLILQVVAAPAVRIAAILPSQATVGQPIDLFVKGEDAWRNPSRAPDGVQIEWVGSGTVDIEGTRLVARTPAAGHVAVRAGGFACRSNPIVISAEMPAHQRYWGDLHAQTEETTGVGTEDEYFTFGRDWARLDFTSHQGNDFQMTDAYWAHLNATVQRYHADGSFVVFPGYEWSGATVTGGDHNVIYRRENRPILRSSHWLIPNTPHSDLSPAHPADQFYAKLKQVVPLDEVLVCQHVGGRYANTRHYFDQALISLVEVVSVWGVFEWILWDAVDKGYVVGVMGNSDGHHGRPGAEGAGMTEFGIKNGLTCVLAESLTRDSVFDALKARRCYATTGARMLLDFTANGQPMGSQLPDVSGSLHIEASVTGDAPLEALQLFCGKTIIAEVRPPEFADLLRSNRVRVTWRGSQERGGARRVVWDGRVLLAGCALISAETHAFDVIFDGIVRQSPSEVVFASKTTGDCDGLDLLLDDAASGTLTFESAAGSVSLDLAQLTNAAPRQTFDFGGLDMQVTIERYPEQLRDLTLHLSHTVTVPAAGQTPYFVKATQADGQMAWASPIYVGGL